MWYRDYLQTQGCGIVSLSGIDDEIITPIRPDHDQRQLRQGLVGMDEEDSGSASGSAPGLGSSRPPALHLQWIS